MNPAETQQARYSLLRYLAAAAPRGLSADLLRAYLRAEGLSLTDRQIQAELQYLADKELVTRQEPVLGPACATWRITAAGRDTMDREEAR